MFNACCRRVLGKPLVLIESARGSITGGTLSAVTAARSLGDITALVAGEGAAEIAGQAAKLDGVTAVVSAPNFNAKVSENYAALVHAVQASSGNTHVVASHGAWGKGIVPRAAALADAAPISDVMQIKGEKTFVRPTYGGNALAEVEADVDPTIYMTVRPTSFDKAAAGGSDASVSEFDASGVQTFDKTEWLEDLVEVSDKPDLTAARVVVSGGRGLKNGDNFKILFDLADKIGNCAVGATRAVVDSGFVPSDMQVGQTGKVVAPELYIAAGLSGAIQHISGMKDSKVIAAINTDEEAPIFSVSDYGLVEDLFQAVPALQAQL